MLSALIIVFLRFWQNPPKKTPKFQRNKNPPKNSKNNLEISKNCKNPKKNSKKNSKNLQKPIKNTVFTFFGASPKPQNSKKTWKSKKIAKPPKKPPPPPPPPKKKKIGPKTPKMFFWGKSKKNNGSDRYTTKSKRNSVEEIACNSVYGQ